MKIKNDVSVYVLYVKYSIGVMIVLSFAIQSGKLLAQSYEIVSMVNKSEEYSYIYTKQNTQTWHIDDEFEDQFHACVAN